MAAPYPSFPASPTIGQTYTDANGAVWTFGNIGWTKTLVSLTSDPSIWQDIDSALSYDSSGNVTITGGLTAGGKVSIPLGTAPLPSLYFGTDTNTGIYSPGADQVGIATNGTSRLVVDASGNLGLGVVPSAWNASSKVFQVSQAAIESRSNGVVLANNGYYNSSGSWIYQNTSAAGLYNIAGNAHAWYTAPSGTAGAAITFTQAMTLDASGNLLVGTTSMLGTGGADVLYARDSYASGIYTGQLGAFDTSAYNNGPIAGVCFGFKYNAAGSFGITGNIQVLKENATDGNYASAMRFMTRANGADVAERARIDSSGRLLVGTSSARTAAIGGSNQVVFEAPNNYFNTILASNTNTTDGSFLSFIKSRGTAAGSHTIVASGDDLGVIDFEGADGSVARSAAQIKAQVDGAPGAGDMPGRLVFSTTADGEASPTERMRISQNGDIVLRNMPTVYPLTDNAVQLGGGGTRFTALYAVNGTIQTSDQREKTEITDSLLGSDFIKSLRPVSYKWIDGGNQDTGERDEQGNYIYKPVPGVRTHWGFIAQEVKQSIDAAGVDFGGWVLTDKDDPQSQQALRYDQFIAPLTKALQEALAEIDVLKAKVAALEAR